jgi:hypothetical protein
MFGNYSKLIGSIAGSLVGMLLAWLAMKGLATCTAGADGTQSCAVWGISDSQITGFIVSAVGAVLVWAFPKNNPNT